MSDGKVYFTCSVRFLTSPHHSYHHCENVYFIGGLGVIWHIVWILVVRSTPLQDRYISKEELEYIQSTVSKVEKVKRKIPWKKLLTSKPVYAITVSQYTDNWGFYTMITQMPMFLAGK